MGFLFNSSIFAAKSEKVWQMSTVLYPSPIFGPIRSRRLGLSLGVNLLPADGKICSFDCIYCECGFNSERLPKLPLPSRELVCGELKNKLMEMLENGEVPDAITFAGNGEPTSHPDFLEIVRDCIKLRDELCPNAVISVLTNSTHILKESIFEALKIVDNALLKLDSVDPDFIRTVDRPTSRYDLERLIARMKEFNGECVIQTMFLKGEVDGVEIDNTQEKYVGPWLKAVEEINPKLVTVYTIDRETPNKSLRKASREELDAIARRVEALGIKVTVSS